MAKQSRAKQLEGLSVHKKNERPPFRVGEKQLVFYRQGTKIAEAMLRAGETLRLTPPSQQERKTEIYYLLQGTLRCDLAAGPLFLGADDYLIAEDLDEALVFMAETDVRFLYIASYPFAETPPAKLQERLQFPLATD